METYLYWSNMRSICVNTPPPHINTGPHDTRWIAAIKRDKWRPTATSMLCNSHVKPENYTALMIYGKFV